MQEHCFCLCQSRRKSSLKHFGDADSTRHCCNVRPFDLALLVCSCILSSAKGVKQPRRSQQREKAVEAYTKRLLGRFVCADRTSPLCTALPCTSSPPSLSLLSAAPLCWNCTLDLYIQHSSTSKTRPSCLQSRNSCANALATLAYGMYTTQLHASTSLACLPSYNSTYVTFRAFTQPIAPMERCKSRFFLLRNLAVLLCDSSDSCLTLRSLSVGTWIHRSSCAHQIKTS